MAVPALSSAHSKTQSSASIEDEQTIDYDDVTMVTAGNVLLNQMPLDPVPVIENGISYREKLRYTVFVMITNVAMGCMYTVTATAFLDLLQHTEMDIGKGSLFFTMASLGYMTGSLISGHLYDKYSRDVIYGTSAAAAGVFTIFVPWPKMFPLVACLLFFSNMCQGSLDSGSTFICAVIWRHAANPYQQSLIFFYALGALLSPVLTEPFFLKSDLLNSTSGVLNTTGLSYVTDSTAKYPEANNTNYTTNVKCENEAYGSSQLYIPFLIIGMFSVTTSAPFVINFYRKFNAETTTTTIASTSKTIRLLTEKVGEQNMEDRDKINISRKIYALALILIGLYFLSYGSYWSLGEFNMPFVVNHLRWTKTEGARLSSGMWGAFAVGGFVCIFVAKFVNPFKMLTADMVIISAGLTGLLFGAQSSKEVVWACFLLIFAGLGSLYPSAICWVDQNLVQVTGKICSLFTVSGCVSDMCNSLVLGHLFNNNLPEWLIYVVTLSICCQWVILLIMIILSRKVKRHTKSSVTVNVSLRSAQIQLK